MLVEETDASKQLDDYEIWKGYVFSAPMLRDALAESCRYFLKTNL